MEQLSKPLSSILESSGATLQAEVEVQASPKAVSIVPSNSTVPVFRVPVPLTPVVGDDRAIAALLRMILDKSGLSTGEVARRLGVRRETIKQYTAGRRTKPGLPFFIRLAEVCGCKVSIELPTKGVR